MDLIAKTFQGLEEVLAEELTELGANDIEIGRRMVAFTGDKRLLYRANFCLRTAVRVLVPISRFTARSADDVYDAVSRIEWSDFLDLDSTFSVDSVVYSTEFRHSKFVAYKVKDAIVDYFRRTTGERPNIRLSDPDIRLNIHIADEQCTLSLDSSGESLHLRGYRQQSVAAPINEVLAAGMLRLAGWRGQCDLVDPFCGSGTILIEAALMARGIAPGVFRKSFGFERWKDFDADLLEEIYNDDSAERPFRHTIRGFDLNQPAVEIALRNVQHAGCQDCVRIERRDFRHFEQPAEPCMMVTNPPYGDRLLPPDLLALYKTIGENLKRRFIGGEAWIISHRAECFEQIGLRPSVKIALYNGALDCELRKYQIFEGKMEAYRAGGGSLKTKEDYRRNAERRKLRPHRAADRPTPAEREDYRYDEGDFADEETAARFRVLRSRHHEFNHLLSSRERRNKSDDGRRKYADGRDKYDERRPRGEKGGGKRPPRPANDRRKGPRRD